MSRYLAALEKAWTETKLLTVTLELTYSCNLDCVICYNDRGLKGQALSYADYCALLQDLSKMNVLHLVLTGGEPLAHPEFWRIAAYARDLGFAVRIKSNGHAVSDSIARRLRDEVDPFIVDVSLHGASAETHDKQTQREGSFVRLLANLRAMHDAGLRIRLQAPLTTWNEHEVAGMRELAKSLQLPLRIDPIITPRDDGDSSPLQLRASAEARRDLHGSGEVDPEALDGLPAEKEYHCGAGTSGLLIDPVGNVFPCVQWRVPVGNVRQMSLFEMWSGSDITSIRTANRAYRALPRSEKTNHCPGLDRAPLVTLRRKSLPQIPTGVAEAIE